VPRRQAARGSGQRGQEVQRVHSYFEFQPVPLSQPPAGAHVVFVDGTCVFCNRLVSRILDVDRRGEFYFAFLQGEYAKTLFRRHDAEPDVDRIYVITSVETEQERLSVDGAAGREIWPRLYRVAAVLRWIPLPILNLFYALFARVRFRLFGRYDACRVPTEDERRRFLS
jgi:predicted DCC family thiol-disulfide oxidoreductase YuxK